MYKFMQFLLHRKGPYMRVRVVSLRPKETVQNLATFLIQTGELGVLLASNSRVLLDVLKCTGQAPTEN